MDTRKINSNPRQQGPVNTYKGFALVATMSILILLTTVALALISLSTISSRSANRESAQITAQANARVALMIALGELQQTMGPDQNISATSGILDAQPGSPSIDGLRHSYLTGIWSARNETLNQTPDYNRERPFKRWLVSHSNPEEIKQMDFAVNGSFPNPVLLADPGGSDPDKTRIYADKISTKDGAYAWWVSDENSKGILAPRDEFDRGNNQQVASVLASFATPGAHGIKALENFENFTSNTDETDRLITSQQLDLAAPNGTTPKEFFHDLSPYPKSVLADVTSGTLRKDLNLYLERKDIRWLTPWGRQESRSAGTPRAPLGPNQSIALSSPSEYDVLSWKSLHHWYNMHRRQVGGSGNLALAATSKDSSGINPISNPAWNSGVVALNPVVVRLQMLMSYSTKLVAPNQYRLLFYSYPVVTLWNPYNVSLNIKGFNIFLHRMPLEHTIRVNGSEFKKYRWEWPGGNMIMRFGQGTGTPAVTLKPGEAKIMNYVTSNRTLFHNHNMVVNSIPWSRAPVHAGHSRDLGIINASGESRLSIETKSAAWSSFGSYHRWFQTTFGFRCEAMGVHNWSARSQQQMFAAQVAWRREAGNPSSNTISENNFPSRTLSELESAPTPFLHLDVRHKPLDEIQLPNKTWLHNIPSHPFAAATSTQRHGHLGVDRSTSFYAHAYTMSFEQKTTTEGLFQNVPFFGSSHTPSGQSRIAAQGIPMAPLTSLAQLQNLPQYPIEALNWSGYHMQNCAIGNSYASPGLPSTEIKERAVPFYLGQYFHWVGGDLNGNLYPNQTSFNGEYNVPGAPISNIDRSYAANHLLFDSYFFSSMAAQEGQVFQSFGQQKSLRDTVENFYTKGEQLPNASYQPYFPRGQNAEDTVDSLVNLNGDALPDSHTKVAKHLLVNGGFNINSTSVPAWTLLLASSHLKRPVTMTDTRPTAGTPGKFVVSRYGVTNGPAADNQAGLSAEQRRWLGYRELTPEEIRELAQAIVKQVKLRGPFRSLAEFVNRRRSSDTDKALYGALQAALEDDDVSINDNYRNNVITAADIQGTNYKFKEAALGSRYQGTPAYISQADILTPVAPVINARSDTFLIRAYGESRSDDGATVLARAWCEAVVQRVPEYVDSQDAAELPSSNLTSEANRVFGRKMIIKSFRWLSPQEI